MIDINELRHGVSRFGGGYLTQSGWSDLIERLEAAESDALEQARLNGMGGEREAALLSKLEAAEKERDALRAKIERMERQVPVCRAGDLKHAESLLPMLGLKPENRLYALPGAKGEEK
ncbi:MAG: hypothetical protein RBT67_12325 [Thauera sp.]|jgi:transposase|nr:hypothetical protein [Thauera sp.]